MAGPATPVVIVGILVRELLRRRSRRPPAPRNCRTGNCRDTVPEEWHHEFPQQFRRSHFRPLDIDIHAPEIGRVIPRPQHQAIHGASCNRDWNDFLADLPPRVACLAFRDDMVAAYHLYLFRRPRSRYPRKRHPWHPARERRMAMWAIRTRLQPNWVVEACDGYLRRVTCALDRDWAETGCI